MRIWSVHPRYLDAKGIVALWREALLARKVLLGETNGYKHHPQLKRFRACTDPVKMIDAYLSVVAEDAERRGYHFNTSLIGKVILKEAIDVTDGQLRYETLWLKEKLYKRCPGQLELNGGSECYTPHPLFRLVKGDYESWEKVRY